VKLSKYFKYIIEFIVILFDMLSVFTLMNLLSISVKIMNVSLNLLYSLLNILKKKKSYNFIQY